MVFNLISKPFKIVPFLMWAAMISVAYKTVVNDGKELDQQDWIAVVVLTFIFRGVK